MEHIKRQRQHNRIESLERDPSTIKIFYIVRIVFQVTGE